MIQIRASEIAEGITLQSVCEDGTSITVREPSGNMHRFVVKEGGIVRVESWNMVEVISGPLQ